MKKSTLNAIMQGVIIVLVIAIVFVIVQIMIRPDEVPVADVPSETEPEVESVTEEVSEPEEVIVVERVRIINDNINVRSGPGTEYERLGSAYNGYDFEFLEQLEEGWTKIIYDGQTAYIYSEYVEVIPMVLEEDGSYSEYVDLGSESAAGNREESPLQNEDDAQELAE